jgi:hypothetical protein
MNNRNNRTAGHNYERLIVKELNEQFNCQAVTSRSESRNMDNAGVDVFGENLPVNIQCKNSKSNLKIIQLFENYNKNIANIKSKAHSEKPLVIFHKKTKKANKKFITEGEFVILRKEDFYNLIFR